MSPSALSLVGFAAWTLVLLIGMAILRSSLILAGRRAANSFAPDGADVSPFANRLSRAHANCYESLPVFAALILAAAVSGHGDVTDALAPWVLAARIGQSTTHLVSASSLGVQVRFAFFLPQVVIQVVWVSALLRIGLAA